MDMRSKGLGRTHASSLDSYWQCEAETNRLGTVKDKDKTGEATHGQDHPGPQIWPARLAQEPRIYHDRGAGTGAGHWGQHSHLQCCRHYSPSPVAVRRSGTSDARVACASFLKPS